MTLSLIHSSSRRALVVAAGVALTLAAGCQKADSTAAGGANAPASGAPSAGAVALVPETARSVHFAAVNRHLDLGGTLYGYVDIDGDAMRGAAHLKEFAANIAATQPAAAPMFDQDFQGIFNLLGLHDVKAVGLSSVPLTGGAFRNKVFLYTPDGRHGLLDVAGGRAGAFRYATQAPVDTDFFVESELDLAAGYRAVRAVVAKVGGDAALKLLDAQLAQVGGPAGVSLPALLEGLTGRWVVIVRVDPERTFTIPGDQPGVVPAFSILVRIEGAAPAIEPALARVPIFSRTTEGALTGSSQRGLGVFC